MRPLSRRDVLKGSMAAPAASADPMALAMGNADMVFTSRQNGNTVTGEVEAAGGGGIRGGAPGGAIEDGRIEGANLSFQGGVAIGFLV
jgi:hypothetical protein